MIYGLNPVQSTKTLLSKLSTIEVNALLQIGIRVLKKEKRGSFLIQLGRHKFTTKSSTPLEINRDYWVQMLQTKDGIIQLKNLHPKPLLLQNFFSPQLNQDFFNSILKKDTTVDSIKNQIIKAMETTKSKDEFIILTQMLLSLHNGVFTIPLIQNGKKMLYQMRKSKLNTKKLEFYIAMNNLGPIEGEVTISNGLRHLKLTLFYQRSAELLKKVSKELDGFSSMNIVQTKSHILPFFDDTNLASFLDIKG